MIACDLSSPSQFTIWFPNSLSISSLIFLISSSVKSPWRTYIGGNFLAPSIVAGAVTLGVMQQIIRAFGRVEGSMQYILKAWPTLIELASVYKRLREFEYKIEQDELIDEKI